jgi:hypothetical protein
MPSRRQPPSRPHPAFQSPERLAYLQAASAGRLPQLRPAPIGRLTFGRSRTGTLKRTALAAVLATAATVTVGTASVAALSGRTHVGRVALAQSPAGPSSAPLSRPRPRTAAAKVARPVPHGGVHITVPSGPSASGLKAPVRGLVDRHHAPRSSYAPAVKSFVVDTSWAALEPVRGGPIVHPNPIDTALTAARAGGFSLKLRVRAGIDAPAWAKSLDGAPMTFYYTGATTDSTGTVAGTVGRFWSPAFGAAYAALQAKLAAAYDGVPEIRETDVTRCQTIFSETYLRDAMDKRNVQTLLAAGFTRALDDACHDQQIQAHDVWKHTLSSVSFNPYAGIRPDGTVRTDLAYTLAQMDYCRSVLGQRCLLANHSLASKRLYGGNYGAMYAHMKALGGPIDFQTATADKIGDYSEVLTFAASVGASSVELPTGYEAWPLSGLELLGGKMKA